MSFRLEKRGAAICFIAENGKAYRLDCVLNRHRHLRAVDEVRADRTRRRLWWRTHVVSRDLPNSRAARADLSDNGRAAALIRSVQSTYCNKWISSANQLPTTSKPTANFYNGRMSKAIAFLCRCQRIKYGSPEHRALEQLLWCVFRNRRKKRRDTLAALHLTRTAYLHRLRTYTAILSTADWMVCVKAR